MKQNRINEEFWNALQNGAGYDSGYPYPDEDADPEPVDQTPVLPDEIVPLDPTDVSPPIVPVPIPVEPSAFGNMPSYNFDNFRSGD